MTEPFECIATLCGKYGLKDKLLIDNKIPQTWLMLLTGHKKSKLFENFLKALLKIKYDDNYNLIYNLYDSKLGIYDS